MNLAPLLSKEASEGRAAVEEHKKALHNDPLTAGAPPPPAAPPHPFSY